MNQIFICRSQKISFLDQIIIISDNYNLYLKNSNRIVTTLYNKKLLSLFQAPTTVLNTVIKFSTLRAYSMYHQSFQATLRDIHRNR